MKIQDYDLPDEFLYDENYSWVKLEDDLATVGITEPGVKQAKEIAFIELPLVGDKFQKGQDYVVLEALKWSGSLKAPLSGEVLEVNEKLVDDPERLSTAPYENWLVKIKLEHPDEVNELMSVKKATEFYNKGK